MVFVAIIAVIIFILIGILTSSAGKAKKNTAKNKPDENLPDWEDLSDDEKTKLSVYSEKGGPLEDLHLFDK